MRTYLPIKVYLLKVLLFGVWCCSRRIVFPSVIICTLLLLGFWIRIQGVAQIPEGQFYGTDPYLYAKQANQIAKLGSLPARDMQRWLPVGRQWTIVVSLRIRSCL